MSKLECISVRMFAYMMSTLYCLGYESIFFQKKYQKNTRERNNEKYKNFFRLSNAMEEEKKNTITELKSTLEKNFFIHLYSCCMDPHRNVAHIKRVVFGWKMCLRYAIQWLIYSYFCLFLLFIWTNKAA